MTDGDVLKDLLKSCGPMNSRTNVPGVTAYTKKDFFGMLREEAGAGLKRLRLPLGTCFQRNRSSDGIAVIFRPSQAEKN